MIYKSGKLNVEEEKVLNKKNQMELKPLSDLPSFLPFEIKGKIMDNSTIKDDENDFDEGSRYLE